MKGIWDMRIKIILYRKKKCREQPPIPKITPLDVATAFWNECNAKKLAGLRNKKQKITVKGCMAKEYNETLLLNA